LNHLPERHFYARDNVADANRALQAILALATAPAAAYIGSLHVTPRDLAIAEQVGNARDLIAKDRRITGPKWDRETQASGRSVNVEGALGDYLTQTLLSQSTAKLAPLVEWRAFGAFADIEAGGLKIDVKTAGAGRKNAAINADAHFKKRADVYLIAKFNASADVADLFVVEADPFSGGWKYTDGHAPYFLAPLPGVA
jgi:hypothetical protein